MALTRRWSAIDSIIAGYNVLLGAVWWANWRESPHAPWIAVAHLAAATLPWLIARAPRRRWDVVSALYEIYPLLLLLAFWTELDLLRSVLGPGGHDVPIRALDLAVFGVHLHQVLLPRFDTLWISEPMFGAYYLYFALIVVPPLVLAVVGRRDALRDATLRLMATYLTCYLVYITFPVYGPHFLETRPPGPYTAGFFYHLVASAQAAGDSHGCAFPSSHVAGAVTAAIVAWRWYRPWLAGVLTVEALGVVVATVYTQNHYGIDALTGVLWALALQLAVIPGIASVPQWIRDRRAAAMAPGMAPLGGAS